MVGRCCTGQTYANETAFLRSKVLIVAPAADVAELFPRSLLGGRGPRGKGDGGPLDKAELKERGVQSWSGMNSRGDSVAIRGLKARLLTGTGLLSCECAGEEGLYARGDPIALAPYERGVMIWSGTNLPFLYLGDELGTPRGLSPRVGEIKSASGAMKPFACCEMNQEPWCLCLTAAIACNAIDF